MKIHFSSSREKTVSHFSSRISRDRDSCQGLLCPIAATPVSLRVLRPCFCHALTVIFFYLIVYVLYILTLYQHQV